MKKIAFALLVLLLFSFCSCSNERILKIYSPELDRTELKGEKFNLNRELSEQYYSVSVKNEKLCVEKAVNAENNDVVVVDYGYYVGVDIGEFGGWVAYFPDNIEDRADGEIVLDENFRGFIQIDNSKVLVLTGLTHLSIDRGKLYLLNNGEATELYNFNSCPHAYTWDGETLYVITSNKLYSYKFGEEPVVLSEKDKFGYKLSPNSIAKLGDSLFCGCQGGIYEYYLETGEEYWYPIDDVPKNQ